MSNLIILFILIPLLLGLLTAVLYNILYRRAVNRSLATGKALGRHWPSAITVGATVFVLGLALIVSAGLLSFQGQTKTISYGAGITTAEELPEADEPLAKVIEGNFANYTSGTMEDQFFFYQYYIWSGKQEDLAPEQPHLIVRAEAKDARGDQYGATIQLLDRHDRELASVKTVGPAEASGSGVYYFYFETTDWKELRKGRMQGSLQLYTEKDIQKLKESDALWEVLYGEKGPGDFASANGTFTVTL